MYFIVVLYHSLSCYCITLERLAILVCRNRGGDIGGGRGGLGPPTFTDKNGAPLLILLVCGILLLTVSNVALVVHLLQN